MHLKPKSTKLEIVNSREVLTSFKDNSGGLLGVNPIFRSSTAMSIILSEPDMEVSEEMKV